MKKQSKKKNKAALADDFEQEVEALRRSAAFQRFLDERSQAQVKVPLEEIEREIEEELKLLE